MMSEPYIFFIIAFNFLPQILKQFFDKQIKRIEVIDIVPEPTTIVIF